jgi:hypothetical protein
MRHRLDGQSPTNYFTLRLAFGIMSMPVLGEMAKMKALAYAGKSPAER